jgi:cytochrome P450
MLHSGLPPREMVPAAIEEGMRWISPIGTHTRQVRQEVELAGVRLPVGARVAAVVASAKRDERVYERVYERPDRFVLGRTRRTHAALASGRLS